MCNSALDTIIKSKKLRCDASCWKRPARRIPRQEQRARRQYGDVTYCKDMAKALGAGPVIVEVLSPDRIPSLGFEPHRQC